MRHRYHKQQGMVLIILLVILVLGMTTMLSGSFNSSALIIDRKQLELNALLHARDSLIGDAVAHKSVSSAGYLRLPDLGFKIGNVPAEGSAAPNFSGNSRDFSVVGKLPWRTLGMQPPRDGHSECLWYIVSGRFKNVPHTSALNWDTVGQIDLIDASGNVIASNLAALVIAPGVALDGQSRALGDPAYVQCSGNYDARNYLDPYVASDAISATINYFSGSSNNRVALSSGNIRLLMSKTTHYNDRFLFIRSDEIFRAVTRRADFAAQVTSLLNDSYFQSVTMAGVKGTDKVKCSKLTSNNRKFCNNWLAMLLLCQLPVPSPIKIDGVASVNCTRVLLFGGQKIAAQRRLSAADKTNPTNYIEGSNLSSFASPTAVATNFSGNSTFNASQAGTDLLKCLP